MGKKYTVLIEKYMENKNSGNYGENVIKIKDVSHDDKPVTVASIPLDADSSVLYDRLREVKAFGDVELIFL